ncbi:MAG: S1 RNA-binding domain-containing protein [Acidobacteriota bacterium]|nr:S1 RNA-binding domain-containing protein [Acidobacteriota bacterium]
MSAELNSADLEEQDMDEQTEASAAADDRPAAATPAQQDGEAASDDLAPPAGEAAAKAEPAGGAESKPAKAAKAKPAKAAKAKAAKAAKAKPAKAAKAKPVKAAKGESAKPQAGPEVEKIRAAMQSGASVSGTVIGWNDGGLHVVVNGVTAFCPHSEMELGEPLDPQGYVDQTYDFFVLRLENEGRRIVLSRVSHLRQEQKAQQAETRGKIAAGAVLKGKVVSVKDFGAFVDLGGVQGLVHISELARRRVERTEDVVQPGDDVEVKVLKVDKGGRRISLSMRALEPDPWQDVASKYRVGASVTGKVEKVERFGAFIQLEPGLSGLLPSSKMSIPAGTTASRVFRPGREITVQVISVDPRRQRISLGLEGDTSEGSRSDFEAYKKSQAGSGPAARFNALADALSKLKQ